MELSTLETKVDFSIIRYANCWEDADVLLAALPQKADAKYLCIASAGDNALALLTAGPASVTAIDLSLPQLYLTELKQHAFLHLAHDELLQFLGVAGCSPYDRWRLYKHIGKGLSANAKRYWGEHKKTIDMGVLTAGKFEKYFRLFRKYLLPLVHGISTTAQLLATKSNAAQQAFFETKWNSWRWRLLMNIFFSKRVMGKQGRDPQFLRQVTVDVPQYIRQRADAHLSSSLATKNYFLHNIFTGAFGDGLPVYLREENFEQIRNNISRLELRQCDAGTAVKDAAYDAYCLSNIFEYFPQAAFEETVAEWRQYIPQHSRLLFWNLMVPRSFADSDSTSYSSLTPPLPPDKGFFYSRFVAEEKR